MSYTNKVWSLNEKRLLPATVLPEESWLEEIIEKNIELLDSGWLVIGRQVKTDNGKFLDLLCMDQNENLIVVELKKNKTPREVTAQVIEYASYMAEESSNRISEIYQEYSEKYLGEKVSLDKAFYAKFNINFQDELIDQKDRDGKKNVKMVIVAAEMDNSTEHIIRFLRDIYDVNIDILFFDVFQYGEDKLLSRTWFDEDSEVEEELRQDNEWNGEFYISFGSGNRRWEDAQKYGFISGGGGRWYMKTLKKLREGDRVWVNIPHTGYVGVGIVTGGLSRAAEAFLCVDGQQVKMTDLTLAGDYFYEKDDLLEEEYVVPVEWIKTVTKGEAVKESGFFGNQNTVCQPKSGKWQYTLKRLREVWGLED